MKTAGIICEYNPFSEGHKYMINKVKEELGPINLVCIMSGNFVQRGKIAVMSKWERAKAALDYGVDLVVQMPVCSSVSSAHYFAETAVNIAKGLKLDYLVFGSTSGDLEALKAKSEIGIEDIEDGNDILGVEYIRFCGTDIEPYTVKIDANLGHASDIRKNAEELIMNKAYPIIAAKIISEDFNEIAKYSEVSEGLENRIKSSVLNTSDFDGLVKSVKSKRYTYTRISRILIQILLGIQYSKPNNIYAHVLGFTQKGREIIRNSDIRLYSNISPEDTADNADLALDVKSDDIFNLIMDNNIYENSDYVCKPIILDI